MAKRNPKTAALQGTLDMLILRTLQDGAAHGHEVARQIRRATKDVLQIEHGSLYPALHRLERKGLVESSWELHAERKREFKYYRLTRAGQRHLAAEETRWNTLVQAVGRVLRPNG
jgi:PadR family transcriptional regulator, regulatory protein PadR